MKSANSCLYTKGGLILARAQSTVNRDEQMEWLRDRLSAKERACMGLRLYHGWSEARIGEQLGMARRTVSDVLTRARATLKAAGIEIPEINRCPRGRARAMDPAELDMSTEIVAMA